MVFIREIVLSSSLSDGLKGGVNSLLKEQQQISFSGLKMHDFFIIRNQPCVPKDEEKWQSHPQDIQTVRTETRKKLCVLILTLCTDSLLKKQHSETWHTCACQWQLVTGSQNFLEQTHSWLHVFLCGCQNYEIWGKSTDSVLRLQFLIAGLFRENDGLKCMPCSHLRFC